MVGQLAALVGPAEVVVKEFPVPDPAPGALVVRIRRANICGTEVHVFRFQHPVIRECVLGHEFVGEVVSLGAGVETGFAGQPIAVADRVVAPYFLTCRRCAACRRGDFNLCQRGLAYWSQPPERAPHFHGTFSTHYYIHPDQYFFRVPDELPDAIVAGANCGLSSVVSALYDAHVKSGERVVIQGAGGLGLYATAVAHEAGAEVIVIEGIPQRIELARRFGADHVIDMGTHTTPEERIGQVSELTDGGADLVIELTGVPSAFTEALHLARPAGQVIEIGNVSAGPAHDVPLSPGLITRKALRITGSVRYQPWYLHKALDFLQRRHSNHPFDELTDREYGLNEVAEAIGRAEAKQVARPAVVPALKRAARR
jgi:threonine dehydrogenase-like Zn-dependent dehydrogenase